MKNVQPTRLSDAPCRDARLSKAIVRPAYSVDMEVHDRLADEVLKMRYLSRLRAFVAPGARS